tara:strand:- start:300 stop:1874 length:1575 start_codon:yes stop_codon:yes gene_type:complete
MADVSEVVQRSMNINQKLGPRLLAAAEQNAILRIGWTNAGDPVPKNGELGLCPALPEGARLRALGALGSWVAAFGKGGSFTLQGDAQGFLGAANQGTNITCEGMAGDFAGYRMAGGSLTVLEGCGHDAGAEMSGGCLLVRGTTGARVGGGMSDGLLVVHGDVAADPGAGMTGGRIVINGRCPTPPPGVVLRPLAKKELNEINKLLEDETMHVPSDAVCLVPAEGLSMQRSGYAVSTDDLSGVGLTSDEQQLRPYETVDTVALVGLADHVQSLALPLPLLPAVDSGATMTPAKSADDALTSILERHPAMVSMQPRAVDILVVSRDNILSTGDELGSAGGFAIDLAQLPPMNAEHLDGLLVALRSMAVENAPAVLMDSISRVQSLHARTVHHNVEVAMARIEDGSGISEAAALPMTGRSKKEHITTDTIQTGFLLGFAASGHDLAVLVASGVDIVSCAAPMADAEDIAYWLQGTQDDLANELRRIGINSIDMLERKHLRALNHETAAVSGLRLAGYERSLPHWFAR